MGGRRDLGRKRQLSIIEEADYSSDDSQGHARGCDHRGLRLRKVTGRRIGVEGQTGITSRSSKNEANGVETHLNNNTALVTLTSNDETSIHSEHDPNQDETRRLLNSLMSSAKYDLPDNSCECLRHTPRKEDRALASSRDNQQTQKVHSISDVKNNNFKNHSDYKNGDELNTFHRFNMRYLNDCMQRNVDGDTDGNIEVVSQKTVRPFVGDKSSIDRFHDMFQVLIKSIDGNQNDNHFSSIGAEELSKTSPLLYLMEEGIEKQPLGVDIIMSSFKEKFSLPNVKRQPVRQKSRRTLLLEKLAEKRKLEEETASSETRDGKENNVDECIKHESETRDRIKGISGIENGRHVEKTDGLCSSSTLSSSYELVRDIDKCKNSLQKGENCRINIAEDSFKNIKALQIVTEAARPPYKETALEVDDAGIREGNVFDCIPKYQDKNSSLYLQNKDNKMKVPNSDNTDNEDLKTLTVCKIVVMSEDDCGCSKSKDTMDPKETERNSTEEERNGSLKATEDEELKDCRRTGTYITTSTTTHGGHDNSSTAQQNGCQSNCLPTQQMPIPIFKRQGPKVYEEDEEHSWDNFEVQASGVRPHKRDVNNDKRNNFLTIPNGLQLPNETATMPSLHLKPCQNMNSSKNVSSQQNIQSISKSSPASQSQSGKSMSFLNPNGSIAKRPMLRHVSQPNMNAHGKTQFPQTPCHSHGGTPGDSHNQSAESKYQTKDIDSDLAKLKATAVRLNLMTRRPSYLEWLEDRRKNLPPLINTDSSKRAQKVKTNVDAALRNDIPLSLCKTNSLVEEQNGQCQTSTRMRPLFPEDRNAANLHQADCCGSDGSSRRNGSSSEETESDFLSSDSETNGLKDRGNNSIGDDKAARFPSPPETCKEQNRKTDGIIAWLLHGPHDKHDKLTTERKERINTSLEWLRNELKAMKSQDQALARQLLTLRHEMHQLRLSWSCQEHRNLLDDVQCDLEDLQEFSKVLDLPSTVYLDTPLKNVGVTRLNISARRFSTC